MVAGVLCKPDSFTPLCGVVQRGVMLPRCVVDSPRSGVYIDLVGAGMGSYRSAFQVIFDYALLIWHDKQWMIVSRLTGASASIVNMDRAFVFQVQFPGGKLKLRFQAESRSEMESWSSTVNEVGRDLAGAMGVHAHHEVSHRIDPASAGSSSPHPATPPILTPHASIRTRPVLGLPPL